MRFLVSRSEGDRCRSEGTYLICRYGVKDYTICRIRILRVSKSIEEFDPREISLMYAKFLGILSRYGCRACIHVDVEPIDVDRFVRKIESEIQVKLVEKEYDPSNMRIRKRLEYLVSLRRKILRGSRPCSISSVIDIVCPLSNVESVILVIEELMRVLSMMGFETRIEKPSVEDVEENFRFVEKSY